METKRYLIFEEVDVEYIWDSKKRQMYKTDEYGVEKAKFDIMQLSKFKPYATLKKETNIRPAGLYFDEKEAKRRAFGLK